MHLDNKSVMICNSESVISETIIQLEEMEPVEANEHQAEHLADESPQSFPTSMVN